MVAVDEETSYLTLERRASGLTSRYGVEDLMIKLSKFCILGSQWLA